MAALSILSNFGLHLEVAHVSLDSSAFRSFYAFLTSDSLRFAILIAMIDSSI
jgi:hypothetical protein